METNKKHELISRLDQTQDKVTETKLDLKRSLDPDRDQGTTDSLLDLKDHLLDLIACINSL